MQPRFPAAEILDLCRCRIWICYTAGFRFSWLGSSSRSRGCHVTKDPMHLSVVQSTCRVPGVLCACSSVQFRKCSVCQVQCSTSGEVYMQQRGTAEKIFPRRKSLVFPSQFQLRAPSTAEHCTLYCSALHFLLQSSALSTAEHCTVYCRARHCLLQSTVMSTADYCTVYCRVLHYTDELCTVHNSNPYCT